LGNSLISAETFYSYAVYSIITIDSYKILYKNSSSIIITIELIFVVLSSFWLYQRKIHSVQI